MNPKTDYILPYTVVAKSDVWTRKIDIIQIIKKCLKHIA